MSDVKAAGQVHRVRLYLTCTSALEGYQETPAHIVEDSMTVCPTAHQSRVLYGRLEQH